MQKLLFVHRWTGVALALFMTIWLSSGLIIVLTEPPAPDRAAQLSHAELLGPQAAWLDPAEAFARGGGNGRAYRWLFNALHHWDLPWLTASRPVWTGWMLIWVALGLGLAISSVYLAVRRLNMTWQARLIARQEAKAAAEQPAPRAA